MTFVSQGPRPNYQSSISPLTYKPRKYEEKEAKHETWVGNAHLDLTEINALDFEQPRALFQKVMSDTDRAHLVYNFASHMKAIKSPAVRDRQLAVLAAVDQSLSDRVAQALGAPTGVAPIPVAPASESWRLRPAIGLAVKHS
ncbi:hypothetical protein EW146_g8859 [Bondarzewia mesenterica]|uniref:Catalase immune-responsive domain-containing protein n=1 Tax=Bondarzewia mesenterica TaxID=1095465 RepID=A0A4S4LB55_9AGAM|nr:hypothetical protein EW146_g8859 [Bondarzewia mesenterica]